MLNDLLRVQPLSRIQHQTNQAQSGVIVSTQIPTESHVGNQGLPQHLVDVMGVNPRRAHLIVQLELMSKNKQEDLVVESLITKGLETTQSAFNS